MIKLTTQNILPISQVND